MDSQFVVIMVGFITLLFAVINSTNNLRKEFREDLKEVNARTEARFDALSGRIDALNAKLDTLMMMLFKQSWNIPVTKEEGKDVA